MYSFKNLEVSHPIAFFDLETTGLLSPDARIVEWSVLRFDPGVPPTQVTMRCNPGCLIPDGASNIHGIFDHHVADLPMFEDQASDMLGLFDGCYISGYNILGFDIPFLNNQLRSIDKFYPEVTRDMTIDVMRIFHRFCPRFRGRRTLSMAYELYCGETHSGAHGAAGDTLATAKVLDSMVARHALPKEIDRLSKNSFDFD